MSNQFPIYKSQFVNSECSGARRNNRQLFGLTLIEMTVVIGIFILVSGAIFSFISYFYRSQRFAFGATAAIEAARKGFSTSVKEIRQAQESEAGNYTLEQAEDYTLTFYSDIDADQRIERVRYFLDGTDFKKGVVEPAGNPAAYPLGTETVSIIAQHVVSVSDPIFTYYNGDWPVDTINNPLSTPANLVDTKLILIKFQFDLNPEASPELYELQAYAQLRNLKNNL